MSFFGLLLLIALIWFIVPLVKLGSTLHQARKTFRQASDAYRQARQQAASGRKAGWSPPQQRRKRIDPEVGEYVKFHERELTDEEIKLRNDGSTQQSHTTYSETRIEEAEWEDIK